MSDELDSERISLEPESLAQEPQVEKKPRCRLQVQWPLGGDLFFDNIRSRAYVVLLLSFYIVSLFIETRNLNSFEIFWAGIALVPVTGIFLRPNDAVVSRLWSLVFIGAVAALNAWVLLNLRDLEDSNSVSFQFAIGIRIVITLVLDLSCILELVNLVFHTPYFFEYRQRVYLESSAEKLKKYRKQIASRTFGREDPRGEPVPQSLWKRIRASFPKDLLVPSVLILSSFCTCFLLVYTGAAVTQALLNVRSNLNKDLDSVTSTKVLFLALDSFITDLADIALLSNLTQSLQLLERISPVLKNVTSSLENSGQNEDALQLTEAASSLTEASIMILKQVDAFQGSLDRLFDRTRNISSSRSVGSLEASGQDSFSAWLSNVFEKLITTTIAILGDTENLLQSLINNIPVPLIIAMSLSLLLSLYATISFAYVKYIKRLREGKPISLGTRDSSDRNLWPVFELRKSALIFGVQFSSALIGFLLVFLLSYVLLYFLFLPETWKIIDIHAFIAFIVQFAIVHLLKVAVLDFWGKFLISPDRTVVKDFRAWRWYYLTSIVLGFITGVLSALTRFGLIIFIGLLSLFRVDVTLFPDSLLRLDTCYVSFRSFVLANHRHDNPVVSSFLYFLNEKGKSPVSKPKQRWQMAYTPAIDPKLQDLRRRAIHVQEYKQQEMVQ